MRTSLTSLVQKTPAFLLQFYLSGVLVSLILVGLAIGSLTGHLGPHNGDSAFLFYTMCLLLLPSVVWLALSGLAWLVVRRRATVVSCWLALGAVLISTSATCVVGLPRLSSFLSDRLELGRYGLGHPVPVQDMADVRRETKLWYPPGTRLVEGIMVGGQLMVVKVTLPPGQVRHFVTRNRFDQGYSRERFLSNAILPKPVQGRWDVDGVRKAISACVSAGQPFFWYAQVLIDLDHPATPVVYCFWQSIT